MEMINVTSSNINKIGYDNDKLVLEYNSGAKYEYNKVPINLFEDLKTTESKGKFVNQYIKGQYEFKRLA